MVKSDFSNMKTTTLISCLTLTLALGGGANLMGGEVTVPNPYLGTLSATVSAELQAKAADLVSKSDTKNRQQVTVAVVKAAVGLNPAAASAVVGTISQSSPDMASVAAATAVALVPGQAEAIARAAAAAAPKQSGDIVQAICRVLPAACEKVADAVAEVAPGAGKDILAGVVLAIPSLKAPVSLALQQGGGNAVSVPNILHAALSASLASQPAGVVGSAGLINPAGIIPTGGAPYVPPSGSPANLDPGSGGTVPTGGRGYASP